MSYLERVELNKQLAEAFGNYRELETPVRLRTHYTLPALSPALRGYMEFHR